MDGTNPAGKLAIDGGTPVRSKPFAPWPVWDEREERMVTEAIRSGKWGGTGTVLSDRFQEKLPEMEAAVARLQDARYGVSVVNGTVALSVALHAAGLKPGDEVIVPPYTFIATVSAPLYTGIIPVFADIEEETLLLDPVKAEQAITPRTKAIMPVHIAGAPADMDRILEVARRHGLRVIEDSAQAIGAQWNGKGVGALGDLGTFSFQSSKNLNCGEGGVIVTNSEELWERAWSICNVGRVPGGGWYQHDRLGQNFRMTELQAALLLAQLTRLEEQMLLREKNAALLDQMLSEIKGIQLIKRSPSITRHAHHLYMFKLAPGAAGTMGKEDFIRKVEAEGIPVSAGYSSLNRNEAILAETRERAGEARAYSCPVSERLCEQEVVWLPHTVLLSDEEAIQDISRGIEKVLQSYQ